MELIDPRQITLNLPQLLLSMAPQKHVTLEGGRGLGKSFIVSDRVKKFVEQMPRAKIAIPGRTYEQLLTRTLPSTISGLREFGFRKDFHYFVGGPPPKKWGWQEAYEPPLSYDYCLTFYNGTTFQLISLDKTESGRGFNFDGEIGDEAALFDYTKFQNNVLLSIRGNLEKFGHIPLHQSTLNVSTTPVSNKGRWFVQREELAKQLPKEYMHLIAPSRFNLKNLGEEYFRNLKRILLPRIYDAEIECLRNGASDKPFYNTFNVQKHTYMASNDRYLFSIVHDEKKLQEKHCKFDEDLINAPIDIALDYNAAICWLVAGQMASRDEYRVLKSFFVKSPKTLQDVVQEFCDYYQPHPTKVVNFLHDHTAVGKDAMRSTSFADEVCRVLVKNGWRVRRIYCGQAPRHEQKKIFFELAFLEQPNNNLPKIRLNQERCKELIVSIEQAGSVDGRDGIKKDKSSEKDDDIPDEEATHGSDAFDTLVYWKLGNGLQKQGYMVHAVA
jgi:hypothetical protein